MTCIVVGLLLASTATAGARAAMAAPAPDPAKPGTPPAEPPSEDCLACHADRDLKRAAPTTGRPASLFVDQPALKTSVHGGLDCVACHQGATAPHEDTLPPVRCATCHADPAAGLAAGVHRAAAAAGGKVPTCLACHGSAHAIARRQDAASPVHRARIHQTCATCHGEGKGADTARPKAVSLFENSIHGRAIRERNNFSAATCSDCHGAHDIRSGAQTASSVSRGNIPATCGRCHAREAREFGGSVHGSAVARGVSAAPTCTSCHGEHAIVATRDPASRVAPLAVSTTCAGCHDAAPVIQEFGLAARRAGTFFDSFHGLALRGGSPVAANCGSCHGTHGILASTDARSRVNPANLAATCAQCHPGAGMQLAAARVHVGPGFGEHWLVTLTRRLYVWLIVLTLGGMIAHNGLDFAGACASGGGPRRREGRCRPTRHRRSWDGPSSAST